MAKKDVEELVNELPDGCWLPKKSKVVKHQRKRVSLRRYAWAAVYGQAPAGQEVYPTCGRKHCVNPKHCDLRSSERAEALNFVDPEVSRESLGAVLVDGVRIPAAVYWEIKNHPPASLAALRVKFRMDSSTIFKIRAGLVEAAA